MIMGQCISGIYHQKEKCVMAPKTGDSSLSNLLASLLSKSCPSSIYLFNSIYLMCQGLKKTTLRDIKFLSKQSFACAPDFF